jgi:hypothetical protein
MLPTCTVELPLLQVHRADRDPGKLLNCDSGPIRGNDGSHYKNLG